MSGPSPTRVQRRLAAILAADVVGYSVQMGQDEEGTLARVQHLRGEILQPRIEGHGGRIFKAVGDGFLAEFSSPVEAVRCAIKVQEALGTEAVQYPSQALQLRIGINLGDIIVAEDGDVYGDGVNVAARLEQLADPGGICVSGAVYDQIEGKIDRAVECRGVQQVKNIARPVMVYAVASTVRTGSTSARMALAIPDKPSIAVLPFTNMSGDPDQDYFADGIVEEIIAALSRFRSLFVIARNSTFTYKGKAVDVRQVSRELGVRYVLEGSVRRSGHRLRIIAQLIDATTGGHIWSERYDGDLADVFDLQDRVTEAIVGALEPTITLSEIERARRKRPDNLDAYDCVMRALPAVWSQDVETTAMGLRLAEQAVVLDPDYALPKALAAWCYAQRVTYMRTPVPAENRAKAIKLAQEAASLDSDEPLVLTVLSAAYSLNRQLDLGLAAINKALALDPNSAWAWKRSGFLHSYTAPDVAIEHFRRAMRLSPLDPMHFNAALGTGGAYFTKGEYDEAARWLEQALREKPAATWAYRLLTTCYANAGRLEEARHAATKFLEAFPGMTVSRAIDATPGTPDFLSRYAHGLRAAGLPE